VSIVDERTGAVSREWYRWFYNLYTITGEGLGVTPVINGGTGLSTIPTNGQLLIGNGTGYDLNTLATGSGISVTNGVGTITLANTGVLSVSFTGGIVTVATPTTTPALTVAGTSGGIPYFSSGTTWASSSALAANAIVLGGGAGAAPATTTTGTGVVTALGVNTGTAGSFVVNGGALGTPSSGTVTNLTGTASININGTVGATTPAAGTFTSISDSGNLTFTGTGNRVIADFSNGTIANRGAFQTSTVNSATAVQIIPNGTGTTALINAFNNSDPTNASGMQVACLAAESRINSLITGTGTYVPMTFFTGGSERARIDTAGNVQVRAGAVMPYAPAPTGIAAAATLTNADIQGQIISATGTTYTITMPLGTTMETLVTWSTTNIAYDFFVINTATGIITMAVNTGVTSLGALTIAIGASAQFRIRRTAANTFVLYRLG
jgi:hypothetical protein